MDINNDDAISGGDRAILASCWLSVDGDKSYIAAADTNGDGDVTGGDRAYLSNNWLCETGDEYLLYPASRAIDTVFGEYESADIEIDLAVFQRQRFARSWARVMSSCLILVAK